ncbi:MAG: dihydropteridine reductase [Clostridia bacterium]|nr:dihydropteridine reductase [Clostridia bacterium]
MVKSEIEKVEKIKEKYVEREATKTEELKALNKKVSRPVQIFAYIFGAISALVFGAGMCLAMNLKELVAYFGNTTFIGIGVGVVGMALCYINYPIYKKRLARRRNKYKKEIIALSDEILNKESK